MTQAKDKLAQSGGGQENAIRIHSEVGREVRRAIEKIGGTLPEEIPAAEHIKEVKKRIKSATPRLELEKKDALGLAGGPQAKIESDDFSDI
jgi:DNA-damage-inducible protein D